MQKIHDGKIKINSFVVKFCCYQSINSDTKRPYSTFYIYKKMFQDIIVVMRNIK